MELYQRIDQDLRYIQEILCEPFLRSDSSAPTTGMSQPPQVPLATIRQHTVATSVTDSIRVLSVILSIRCQMITLQSLFFTAVGGTKSNDVNDGGDDNSIVDNDDEKNTDWLRSTSSTLVPTLYDAIGATSIWLQSVETTMKSSKTTSKLENRNDGVNEAKVEVNANEKESRAVFPLLQSLHKELKAWKYCFETCAALEQFKYVPCFHFVFVLKLFCELISLKHPASCYRTGRGFLYSIKFIFLQS